MDNSEPTKKCTSCSKVLPIESFTNDKSKADGKRPSCRECKKKTDFAYREANKEKKRENDRKYYQENSDKIKLRAQIWYSENTERHRSKNKEYLDKNKESVKKAKQAWNLKNAEKIKEYMNEYQKNRYRNDTNYRIKSIVNKRLRDYVRNKIKPTLEYLGCSLNQFKTWISSQFDEKMTWDNLGEYWWFDHIKPCDSFDLSKDSEIYKCYNWTNLRPLEKVENMSKCAKVDQNLIDHYLDLSMMFQKLVLCDLPTNA